MKSFLKRFCCKILRYIKSEIIKQILWCIVTRKKSKHVSEFFNKQFFLFVFLFLFKEKRLNKICRFELFEHRQKEGYKFYYLTFYDSILLKKYTAWCFKIVISSDLLFQNIAFWIKIIKHYKKSSKNLTQNLCMFSFFFSFLFFFFFFFFLTIWIQHMHKYLSCCLKRNFFSCWDL